jgi:peptidoglycan/LPS O-acetylase OafA/YrhL
MTSHATDSMSPHHRFLGVDLLRGICALEVALYHILYSQHLLPNQYVAGCGVLAAYAVHTFFILSGASMIIAYAHKLSQGMALLTFLARRYFRLAPLYWLILLTRHPFGTHLGATLLNMSFLFGFANPAITARISVAWSLGIEFVFYCVFPLFVTLTANKRFRWLWLIVALGLQFIFVRGVVLDSTDDVALSITCKQFLSYIGYFYVGCLVGRLLIEPNMALRIGHRLCWLGFVVLFGVILFGLLQSDSTTVARIPGLILTLGIALLAWLSACLLIPHRLAWIPRAFGAMSYGLYLLHLRLYDYLDNYSALKSFGPIPFAILVVALTISAALFLERYFERPIKLTGYRWLATNRPPMSLPL